MPSGIAVRYAMERWAALGETQRARFFDVPEQWTTARIAIYYDDPEQAPASTEAAEDLQDALNSDPKQAFKIRVEAVYEPAD